ncbi:acetolactate decarboxylase [uncultured Pseudodesulfovibrio sp.]|uniref:acetolactate decarboxylase n=1 Tax=uncultured Pseudodesulfovibrio sp. TaxID=2035858 RepID=UPI0029C89C51|nr:acetolactate decarboxylase [uncultured Pseudodesulfovibrio sp.]
MRLLGKISVAVFLIGFLFFGQTAQAGRPVYQYATIDALLAGLYDGQMTLEELKFKGDFGLGTLNGLDGELVVLDGQAYHIMAGGKASIPADSSRIPFAAVCFFEQDATLKLSGISSLEALNTAILKAVPSRNIFCAIRIDADFRNVKARAIPKQNPPYAPLAELVKEQVVVNFSGQGTLVGIYSPSFVKGVGVPGFHWHFLTADHKGGGHVLDCEISPASARLDFIREFTVQLPDSETYDAVDLTPDRSKELHSVEKDSVRKQ